MLDHGNQEQLAPGTLAVVATPLGHLGDISARAASILSQVDLVLAEDTRRSRILLSHLHIQKKIVALHAHNEFHSAEGWLDRLAAGSRLALITDAGTPAISDPGAHLVAQAHARGLCVVPIPGPSALVTALCAAGFMLDTRGAWFVGFLSRRSKNRRSQLNQIEAFAGVIVLFESPARIGETLQLLAQMFPDREACLCRELTKRHEEIRRATLSKLAHTVEGPVKGECTLVIGPNGLAKENDDEKCVPSAVEPMAHRLLSDGLSARDAAIALKTCLKISHSEAYRSVQEIKSKYPS